MNFFIYPFYFTIMILSASILGETAGAGTHQVKSKKGQTTFPFALIVAEIISGEFTRR